MFHALDPNAGPQTASKDLEDPNAGRQRIKPYSLAYMTSIFTEEPYYKEAGRDEEGRFMRVNGDANKLHQVQEYNTRDACVTLEIARSLYEQAKEAGLLDPYKQGYRAIFRPNLTMGRAQHTRHPTVTKKTKSRRSFLRGDGRDDGIFTFQSRDKREEKIGSV